MKKVLKITLALSLVFITVFTASPLAFALYSPEECPQFKNYGKHRFDYSDTCYYCGAKCTHNGEISFTGDYETKDNKHYKKYQCQICYDYTYATTGEPCTPEYTKDSGDRHRIMCKVCGDVQYGNCSYKTIYSADDDVYHEAETFCTICKTYKQTVGASSPSQKHTYKNNKCTVCGFVKIIPGKTGAKTFKCTSAKKVKRTINAHWDQNWNWIPAKSYYVYVYKFKVKLKKAKNAQYYVVSDKTVASNVTANKQTSKKNSLTYVFESSKPIKKAKIYIYAVSKSGTAGKVVKKAVKFKKVK